MKIKIIAILIAAPLLSGCEGDGNTGSLNQQQAIAQYNAKVAGGMQQLGIVMTDATDDSDIIGNLFGDETVIGVKVKQVLTGALAHRSGMRAGDIITHVNLQTSTTMVPVNSAQLKSAVPKFRGKKIFRIIRNNQIIIVPVQFRSATDAQTAGVKKSASGSVADELKKLHALRKSGAITKKEYQAQKSKLLSQ